MVSTYSYASMLNCWNGYPIDMAKKCSAVASTSTLRIKLSTITEADPSSFREAIEYPCVDMVTTRTARLAGSRGFRSKKNSLAPEKSSNTRAPDEQSTKGTTSSHVPGSRNLHGGSMDQETPREVHRLFPLPRLGGYSL